MKHNSLGIAALAILSCFPAGQAAGQADSSGALSSQDAAGRLPLRRISLYSSGVGYFERQGSLLEPLDFPLSLPQEAVKDALKSLTVSLSPQSLEFSPTVTYPSEDTLTRTLRSLRINLLGNPGLPEILGSLRGSEVELGAPASIKGRVVGVEQRVNALNAETGQRQIAIYLTLSTQEGIRSVNIEDINGFSFTDPGIAADLDRALDLIAEERDAETRELRINLPGNAERDVRLSYVIPVPVWKVSYRLDLSGEEAIFQGWAIVDNDGDQDWDAVELTLVSGRPISFIQDLYSPYYLSRPEIPLAIAGTAESRTYESGYDRTYMAEEEMMDMAVAAEPMAAPRQRRSMRLSEKSDGGQDYAIAGGSFNNAQGASLGEQFAFTLPNLVTLKRRQSAMVPLTEGVMEAEKLLTFTAGANSARGNPAVCVELENITGMKLPPGPMTVYDQGTYAGDALIEFFPEKDKRLIAYGEDLSVTVHVTPREERTISAVKVSGGVMTINRTQLYQRDYTARNASGESKLLILEHPITRNGALMEPSAFREKTSDFYRFDVPLPPEKTITFTVKEEVPVQERITLSSLRFESLISYAQNGEIPLTVRRGLSQGVELRRNADEIANAIETMEAQVERLIEDQDRIRRNMEALGSQSPQGQVYQKRIVDLDAQIDSLNSEIETKNRELASAREAFDIYLNNLEL